MPRVYRELRIIPNSPITPRDFLDVMARRAQGGWQRGDFLHTAHPERTVDSHWAETEAFHRDSGSSLEMVILSIGDGDLVLSNILCSTHDLSLDEFNAIAERFISEAVEPALVEAPAEVVFSEEYKSLEQHLDPATFEKLKQFSAAANKASSAFHPLDRGRWLEFLASACAADGDLDAPLLKSWLIEEGGWPPDIAAALAAEFAFGRVLIARYAEGAAK